MGGVALGMLEPGCEWLCSGLSAECPTGSISEFPNPRLQMTVAAEHQSAHFALKSSATCIVSDSEISEDGT